jgi:DDE family transposase
MHRRLVSIVARISNDVAEAIDPQTIRSACLEAGYTYRQRLLDPVATIHAFLLQVLHCNAPLTYVSQLMGRAFSAAAYCQARARLPLAVFKAVLRDLAKAVAPEVDGSGTWFGHRVFVVDGSSCSMPDEPELQRYFGQSRKAAPGCGFPVAHLIAMFHVTTGMLIDIFAAPLHSHDMSLVGILHSFLKVNDLLVADRGFCSYAHIAVAIREGWHAVFRVHQKQIVDFTPGRPHAHPKSHRAPKGMPRSRWVRAIALGDQIVEWFKPVRRPTWMSAEHYASLPDSILVRELRYRIHVPGFRTREVTLATTLLDGDIYPSEELAKLYGKRWNVELHLRQMKQTMGMDVLHCKTLKGVMKELVVYAMVYNLVRTVICEAARRQGEELERISFVDALRWLATAKEGQDLPRLVVNPYRPNRAEPRVIKRRPKQYPWMSKPRAELRKRLLGQAVAA